MANTRWATHGKVNDINSHPHDERGFQLFTMVLLKMLQKLETHYS